MGNNGDIKYRSTIWSDIIDDIVDIDWPIYGVYWNNITFYIEITSRE